MSPRTWEEVRALAMAEHGACWPCLYPLRPAPVVARPPWPVTPAMNPAEERAMAVFDAATPAWEARLALEETVFLAEQRLAVLRRVEGWEDTRAGMIVRIDAVIAELDALRPVAR